MDWQHELKSLRHKWYLNKYQAAQDFGVPLPKPYRDDTTNGLTRCITDFLKFSNHYVNRINSQGQVRAETVQLAHGNIRKNYKWVHGATNRGTADLDAIIAGRTLKIEIKCKATKDRLRPDQLKEKARIEQAGGVYYVVTDMASFLTWYKQLIEVFKMQKL